jgi:SAM-dependent MidA family methyltransferase
MTGWMRWRDAMQEALYGPGGFYTRTGAPAAHFRTSAHVSPQWAEAIAHLAERSGGDTVVEIGAGGGELAAGLANLLPSRWRIVAVDVAPRPATLPERVEWAAEPPAAFDGLLIAVEWLDVVPVDVAERTEDGLRLVEVTVDGDERADAPVPADAADWLDRWWPLHDVGDRAEVGLSRDEAWAAAVARLRRGLAVAVDYAVDPARDVAGTLTGYRDGRQALPVPDGSCDLTAHVLMESCAAAVGGDVGTRLLSQRDALRALGVHAPRPAYAGDPRAYLQALQATGEAAELLDPSGLGGFMWLVHARGVDLPF